jgi:hypothetical protein
MSHIHAKRTKTKAKPYSLKKDAQFRISLPKSNCERMHHTIEVRPDLAMKG